MLPTEQEQAIWRDVERELGHTVSSAVRDYVMERLESELSYLVDEQRVELLSMEVSRLQRLPLARKQTGAARSRASVEIPDGERWQLLYDLGRLFERKYRGTPVADEFHGFAPLTLEHYEDTASYPASQRIRVEFDAGMDLATVFAILRREFRERYRPKGRVRTTRPLGERASPWCASSASSRRKD